MQKGELDGVIKARLAFFMSTVATCDVDDTMHMAGDGGEKRQGLRNTIGPHARL